MKYLIIVLLLVSFDSYSCEERIVENSAHLVGINIGDGANCKQVSVILEQYVQSTDLYISSYVVNILNSKKEVEGSFVPEKSVPAYGQILLSFCLSDDYLRESLIAINLQRKNTASFANDGAVLGGAFSLCPRTEYLKLGSEKK